MWILNSSRDEIYYLFPKEHVVGRKNSDLILSDDQSISKKHAVFSVVHKSENWNDPDKPPIVILSETCSKYGTFISTESNPNPIEMPKNSEKRLHNGDQIKFGKQWNDWKLVYEPLIVTVSTLSATQKTSLKNTIGSLGGHMVSNWGPECTHLTMCNLTLTIKAICALAHGKMIVTPEFWKNYVNAVTTQKPLPKYEDFIPPLAETMINKNEVSFLINKRRRTLFQGKKVMFFSSQQCKEHSCLVTAAGGTASVVDTSATSLEKLIKPDVIVMQHLFDSSSQNSPASEPFIELNIYLRSKGKRVIPVSEIGLAILHCSIEKYCNPDFNFASSMLSSTRSFSSHSLTSQPILALETQDDEVISRKRKQTVSEKNISIPESGTVPKKPRNAPKIDESDPTMSLDCFAKTKESSQSTADIETDNSCSSSRVERSAQKRSRTLVNGDEHASKRPRITEAKGSGMVKKSNIENEDKDLFSFASDVRPKKSNDEDIFAFSKSNVKIPESREEEEEREDMFSFSRSKYSKRQRSTINNDEGEEDMFAFTKSDSTTNRLDGKSDIFAFSISTASSSHQDKLQVDNIQSVNKKRKLPDEDENSMADNLNNKLLLNDISDKSHVKQPDYYESQSNFISVKVKEDNIKEETDSSLVNSVNKSVVTIKPLVCSNSSVQRNIQKNEINIEQNASTMNFKKFKKVQFLNRRIVPHIIGGQDLMVHAKDPIDMSGVFNEDDLDEEENKDNDFWAFVTASQFKRRAR